MKPLQRKILEQLVEGLAEPVLVAQIDRADWPVVMCNPSFDRVVGDKSVLTSPFADVIEQMLGRDLALEISEVVRQGQAANLPVEVSHREYLLALKPLSLDRDQNAKYYAAYWRSAAGYAGASEEGDVHQALLNAKRRIRDLSRDDPVTGLLNATAFRDVLAHDWAVAAREQSHLALVAFSLNDFDKYRQVFGRHASDSCQRRVAQGTHQLETHGAARAGGRPLSAFSVGPDHGRIRPLFRPPRPVPARRSVHRDPLRRMRRCSG